MLGQLAYYRIASFCADPAAMRRDNFGKTRHERTSERSLTP